MSEEEKRELFKEHKGLVIYYDTYVKVKEYYKLHQENTQLKRVLKEIREYIKDNSAFMNDDEWEVFNKKEILEIIDKAEIGEDK